MEIAGVLIIELAELDAIKRAAIEHLEVVPHLDT
jgi:hypothetical protein